MKNELLSKYQVKQSQGWGTDKLNRLIETNQLQTIETPNGVKITKQSLEAYLEYEQNIHTNYVTASTALGELGYTGKSIYTPKTKKVLFDLRDQGFLDVLELDFPIANTSVWVSKKSLSSFLKSLETDYVEWSKVLEEFGWSRNDLYYKIEQHNLPTVSVVRTRYILNESLNQFRGEFYTTKEASEILGLPYLVFKHFGIHNIFNDVQGTKVYRIPKSEVERVKAEIKRLRDEYYTYEETIEFLKIKDLNKVANKQIVSIDCPPIAKGFAKDCRKLYLKESVHEYAQNRMGAIIRQMDGITPANPIDFFKQGATTIDCCDYQKETKELFVKFIISKMSKSNASKETLEKQATEYLSLLKVILEFPTDKEVYLFSNVEANQLLDTETRQHQKETLYYFLKYLTEKRICKFNIRAIRKPERMNVPKEKEVYDFEQFLLLYSYATFLDIHVQKAIESNKYASTWLYVLMHLSNAWRNSDVIKTPPVFPEAIQVYDLSWFKSNSLNLVQGQTIVNQLRNFELVISKTGMRRHFFCNKDLVIPIATAMVICEFHRRKLNTPYLINFLTKRERIPETYFTNFFKEDKRLSENLKFSSLKMNRTLMTHLFYSIQERNGKGNSAFELVQALRNHVTDITKVYILSKHKDADTATIARHLFDRGEFGYIYDRLVDVLMDSEDTKHSLTERTNAIVSLRKKFSPIQVEAMAGFLDTIEAEKRSIITKIKQLSKEEAFEYIRKIYLQEMPSKMEHIQCFNYPECHKLSADKNTCHTCAFAIPNMYALTALANDIRNRIKKYMEATKPGVKKREYINLERALDLLNQALEEFGEDFVWTFIEGGEEALENQLAKIDEV
jgi:hypothetical protein